MAAMTTPAGVALFTIAAAESFNIFSALNSSPWTAENFGADERKAQSCKEYVAIAVAVNAAMGLAASKLAGDYWPLLGTTVVSVLMILLYWRALHRGLNAGAAGWTNDQAAAPPLPDPGY
jgi:hypothetical protein